MKQRNARPSIRCAVYTRKSTEEGLEQEFNSLDAQRESAEAFIKSQAHEGWICLPEHYDDGGFTGGNMDRPALRRLIADIEAGKVDCVVVYKVDRLSRSLLDFSRMMEVFDRQNCAFVSVTQQFCTTHSMGRLTLNILLSFAQFEREIIGERTRDKIAAARRKGKWSGGTPILGYDVVASKLVVNEAEAQRVRAIFGLYLEHEGLLPVVQELGRRGWHNKQRTTKKGQQRGGKPFTKTSLHHLLTNVAYIGKVKHKTDTHDGEHAAILDAATWQKAQALLGRNGRSGGAMVRNQFGAILKSLVRCVPCDCAMTPAHSTRGTKRYRYYTCSNAQKRGWHTCPSKSVPAAELERFVVERIKGIGQDAALVRETLTQASRQADAQRQSLEAERRMSEKELAGWNQDLKRLLANLKPGDESGTARLADLQERIATSERRLHAIAEELESLDATAIDEAEASEALARFDGVWQALTFQEQGKLLRHLIQRIDYDGGRQRIALVFHPTGIGALAAQCRQLRVEAN
ncbi:MAG: recombinase family protein [Gemmataceae bacterium]|nr:recombinase family protein [Gemmataceae bacterium]